MMADMYIELKGIEETGLARLDGTMSDAMMQYMISSVHEEINEREEELRNYINQVRFYLLLLSLPVWKFSIKS